MRQDTKQPFGQPMHCLLVTPPHAIGSSNTHMRNPASTRARSCTVNPVSLGKNKVYKGNAYIPWALIPGQVSSIISLGLDVGITAEGIDSLHLVAALCGRNVSLGCEVVVNKKAQTRHSDRQTFNY